MTDAVSQGDQGCYTLHWVLPLHGCSTGPFQNHLHPVPKYSLHTEYDATAPPPPSRPPGGTRTPQIHCMHTCLHGMLTPPPPLCATCVEAPPPHPPTPHPTDTLHTPVLPSTLPTPPPWSTCAGPHPLSIKTFTPSTHLLLVQHKHHTVPCLQHRPILPPDQ